MLTSSGSLSDRGTQPPGSFGFDLLVALLTLWIMVGAYVDAWAHTHLGNDLETFFTPWHAVLYSGFLATAVALLVSFGHNLWRGSHWRRALPVGYGLSLVGVAIFGVGGVGDLFWHELFGIEIGIEGAFSPTHQLLELGMVLLVAGPLRSAWHRQGKEDGGVSFPGVLSLINTLGALVLITQVAHPFTEPLATTSFAPTSTRESNTHQVLGLLGVVLQSGLLMGTLLLVLRRWRAAFPPSAVTAIIAVPGLAILVMQDQYRLAPAILVAAGVSGLLLQWLRQYGERQWPMRLFSSLVPMVIYVLYFFTLAISDDIWWSIHVISGAVAAASATGLLLGVLVFHPTLADES